MTTAVDTNVLLDILAPDSTFGPYSAQAVRAALDEGRLVACEIVWAELVANYPSPETAEQAMNLLGLEFSPATLETAFEAGQAWKAYRQRGGPRVRIIGDFLIGAHALCQADRLLTRDRGFYRAYFKHLSILDPKSSDK